MNLYNKMKNLESKYIDLANFYKQELVKSNKKEPANSAISPRSQSMEEERKGLEGAINSNHTDRSNHQEN